MLPVKTGTNVFGQTNTKLTGNSATRTRTGSVKEMQEVLGDKSLGEFLNSISDPNYTDPAKKAQTAGNSELDRDAFFKLMLQQMKSQDPTNPLKSHEMAAQLAQFSSIEQLNNIDRTLNEMKDQARPTHHFQALSMIGKTVSGDSAQVMRATGDKFHELQFDLPVDAKTVTVDVQNGAGETVRSYRLSNLKKGTNNLTWNGLTERGTPARPGQYQFVISAESVVGKKVPVSTEFEGQITGVNLTPAGPVMMVGDKTVRLSDVSRVEQPQVNTENPSTDKETLGDSKKDSVQGAKLEPRKQVMEAVAMDGGMMNRLKRETAE